MSHQRKDLGDSVSPSAAEGRLTASVNISARRIAPLGKRARPSRYRLAGAAAEELIKILGAKPTDDNRRLWAYYCYHHDIEIIFEKAYQYASEYRQGEIKKPVTAFQRWLSRTYGCEGEGSRCD